MGTLVGRCLKHWGPKADDSFAGVQYSECIASCTGLSILNDNDFNDMDTIPTNMGWPKASD